MIISNINASQIPNIKQCCTSHQMWEALQNLHEQHRHDTAVHNLQTIFKTFIAEDADIPYHLNNIKSIWENVSKLSSMHYNFSDEFFKLIITCILPPLWYTFAKAYMGSETDLYCNNPKCSVSSQEFLGILISEYYRQHSHAEDYHPDNNSIETSNIAMSHNWQGQ
jgi:gag-polypeptide of LTR copia-type